MSSSGFGMEKPATKPRSEPQSTNLESVWSTKTPDKRATLPGRSRNSNASLALREVRQAAETMPCESKDQAVQIKTARRQILSSPRKPESSGKLPERFEILCEFFNGLDTAIRLLKLKGSSTTLANISPKIESLSDRRFSYTHLAQMKYIFPEAIEIKRVLKYDETTSCMKPDLHLTLNTDAIPYDDTKCESKNMELRKVFRSRLADFFKAYPKGDEIPEEMLPEPFNLSKAYNRSHVTSITSSSGNEPSSSVLLEASRSEGFSVHEEEVEEEQCGLLVSTATSADVAEEQQLSTASHLSRPLHRRYRISPHEKTISASALSEIMLSAVPASTEQCLLHTKSRIPATPIKDFSTRSKEMASTPAQHASTPARLMSATPALRPSKRCIMMSPDDDSVGSPNTLVRRPSRTRSLKFDTPEEDGKLGGTVNENSVGSPNKLVRHPSRARSLKFGTLEEDGKLEDIVNEKVDDNSVDEEKSTDHETYEVVVEEFNKKVEDELHEINDASDGDDDDSLDILPKSLRRSIKEKEKTATEEQNPAISQTKRRRQTIATLPKLFNIIHFLFQSIRRTVITKEELLHKIIAGQSNITDRKEVEEQLNLMLELVPEWISETKASSGDLLVCIDKMSAAEAIRARLEEATSQEISTVS